MNVPAASLTVAALQHDIIWEDPPANFARLGPRISAAAAAGAQLVLLSEMFATGFTMNAERVAEPPDGPTATFLREQAMANNVWVGGSFAERTKGSGERPRNCFALASPAGDLVRYDKIHPFSYAGEDEYYQAGSRVVTVDIAGVRVTPFVCYDLRFADVFWDAAVATDVFVVVANWPASRRLHWCALLAARAIENQAYVVGVNRVGVGDGMAYVGDSRVIDPLGEVIAAAEGEHEVTLRAAIEVATVAAVRQRFAFLPDRRFSLGLTS
jgi:predicted amidohydrolase